MFLTSGLTISGGLTIGSPSDSTTIYNSLLLTGQYGSNAATNNTFVDSSAYNHTITRTGTPAQGSFSPYDLNNSVFFNGTSDYLTLPASTNYVLGTNNFTIEAYVYVNTVTGSQTIIDMRNGTAGATGVWLYLNTNTIRLYTAGADRITSSTVAIGTWYHVALVRNSGVTTMYLNGTATGSTYADTNTYILNSPFIGRDSTAASNYMSGYISNLRIVRGTALYTATFTPPTATLTSVSGTTLLVCQSNRFIDNSSNLATVTAVSGPEISGFSPFVLPYSYNPDTISQIYFGSGYFNGSSYFLNVAYSNTLIPTVGTDFTLEVWVYQTATASTSNILGMNSATQVPWRLGINTSYELLVGNVTITSGTPILNAWTHLCFTISSNSVRLFVNGTQVGSTTTLTSITDNSLPVTIAARSDSQRFWPGYMAGIRIIKGTALYTSNFTPPTLPLTSVNNTTLLMNFTNAGIYDFTMNSGVVTVGDAQLRTTVTKYNPTSIFFDGTGDYLLIPNSSVIQLASVNFTIECWVYFNSVASGQQLLSGYTSSSFTWGFNTAATGTLNYYLSSNGTTWNIASGVLMGNIVVNQWIHVALVRDGSTFTPYINGTAGTTATSSASIFSNPNPMYVGALPGGSAFSGYIDDLRITRGLARYTANFTPPSGPLPLS